MDEDKLSSIPLRSWVYRTAQNASAFYGLALSVGPQGKYKEALVAIDQATKLAPAEQQYLKVKEMFEFNAKSR